MPTTMTNAYYNKATCRFETAFWFTDDNGKSWYRKFGGDRVSTKDVNNVKPRCIR